MEKWHLNVQMPEPESEILGSAPLFQLKVIILAADDRVTDIC